MKKAIQHYSELTGLSTKQVKNFIEIMRQANRVYESDGFIAFYILVDDDDLELISKDALFLHENVKDFLGCDGNNLHIFGVFSEDRHNLLKELKQAIRKYKSVSWWSRDLDRLFIRRS